MHHYKYKIDGVERGSVGSNVPISKADLIDVLHNGNPELTGGVLYEVIDSELVEMV